MVVDLDWKVRMTPEISVTRSPKLSPHTATILSSPKPAAAPATSAYEHYLRLAELRKLLSTRDFPDWSSEPILKPALQALEITFRFISIVLSDPRPYSNRREWSRRLESLATHQIELIAAFCEDDGPSAGAPTSDLGTPEGVLSSRQSSQEVWKLPGAAAPLVSRTSEASLLPRLVAWEKSEAVASKILFEIECQMRRSPFTLGLGEPNLAGKPNLEYDRVVRPSDLHVLKKSPAESGLHPRNKENDTLLTAHQILESWLFVAGNLLQRIVERIEGGKEWEKVAADCWILERVWKLLAEIEDVHLLMDPDDFLRLKSQLAINASSGSEAFCFRSAALVDVTRASKELKRLVPEILGVEADPTGGPRVQEAAMKLFHSQRRGEEEDAAARIHVLQALQATDAAVKKFYFAYRQLIVAVMGSLEACANGRAGYSAAAAEDSLAQVFLEPPYLPSLDGAKTFLGEFWRRAQRIRAAASYD